MNELGWKYVVAVKKKKIKKKNGGMERLKGLLCSVLDYS